MARLSKAGSNARKVKASKPTKGKGREVTNTKRQTAVPAKRPRHSVSNLTKKLKQAREQQSATAKILKIIASSPDDLQPVLEAVADYAMSLLDAWSVLVTRFDGELLHFGGARGALPDTEQFLRNHYPMRPEEAAFAGHCILERSAINISDAQTDPSPQNRDRARLRGFRAALSVPMLRDGQPIGVITVSRRSAGAFAANEVELLQTFADQAVIAIENARLFNEVQAKTRDLTEALTYQTGSANILSVIASSPTDVGPVLKAIVESACELCDASDAIVFLKDGEDLRFSAHHGSIPINIEKWPINRNWVMGRSVVDRVPVHVHDLPSESDDFPEGRELARHQGIRTVLIVPLLCEGESIGVIGLRRTEVHPFSDKQIALLQTFADQAVIAIGNVRLFDEVQAKTRDLSEALEYQTATGDVLNVISRSPNNLQPVMDTIVETAHRLCNSDYALIVHRRDDGFYGIVGHANASPELLDWMHDNPVAAGDGSAVGIVAVEKKTLHLHDSLSDSRFTDLRRQRVSKARTMLAVPLMQEDQVVGVVFLARTEVQPFTERQVDLITSFADQAVIAISNVNLFEAVQDRTSELSKSLDDLRTAQDRLVQTEKLASLGQLTAGIAHEIKNPLNFVNNFSALSAELTVELNDLLKDAALTDKMRQEVEELTGLLKNNLEKVVQHGKRADSIVKNMLLHSREGSGEQRSADINALVDESLNLAYHGARAEKAGFNITLQRDFDASTGTAELFPQEITRALLNLISNGFYAATKRNTESEEPGFEPTLLATTKNLGSAVEIRIRDNGTGIPREIREKMFNPFFTTKPAGEGTGLGLSMTHDIIVKQHGGKIDVATEPGQFTEFTIILPRNNNLSGGDRGEA